MKTFLMIVVCFFGFSCGASYPTWLNKELGEAKPVQKSAKVEKSFPKYPPVKVKVEKDQVHFNSNLKWKGYFVIDYDYNPPAVVAVPGNADSVADWNQGEILKVVRGNQYTSSAQYGAPRSMATAQPVRGIRIGARNILIRIKKAEDMDLVLEILETPESCKRRTNNHTCAAGICGRVYRVEEKEVVACFGPGCKNFTVSKE